MITAAFLVFARGFWVHTVDDAYISARYALNAATGRGLVFNPGEHVMGYTNLLLVLLETLAYRLGGDGLLYAKVIGVVCGVIVLWLTISLGLTVSADDGPAVGLLAAGLLLAYPCLPLVSVMGLETSLFTALCLAAVLVFLKGWLSLRWGWLRQAGLAVLLALATLTRPEGMGVAISLALIQIVALVREVRLTRPFASGRRLSWHALWWIPAYFMLLLPAVFALTMYYGSPIPNTFWAKTASGFSVVKYFSGMVYLRYWLGDGRLYWIVPFVLWPFLTKQELRGGGVMVALTAFALVWVMYAGVDWMPGYRFLVPALPLVFVLAAAGMIGMWKALLPRLAHLSRRGRIWMALLLLVVLLAPSLDAGRDLQRSVAESARGYDVAHRYVGEWLRDETPADASVALMDIGMIGFLSDRYVFDITGLVNPGVARLMHKDLGWVSSTPETARQIADLILAGKPSYIVLVHHNPPGVEPFVSSFSQDTALYESSIFRSHYRYLFSRQHRADYYLSLYARSDG